MVGCSLFLEIETVDREQEMLLCVNAQKMEMA